MVRVTVEPTDTFAKLGEKVCIKLHSSLSKVLTIRSFQKSSLQPSTSIPSLFPPSQAVQRLNC